MPSSPESAGYEHSHIYQVIINDDLRSYVRLPMKGACWKAACMSYVAKLVLMFFSSSLLMSGVWGGYKEGLCDHS